MRTKITRVGDEEENNSAIEPNIGSSRHCHAGHDPKACMIFFLIMATIYINLRK